MSCELIPVIMNAGIGELTSIYNLFVVLHGQGTLPSIVMDRQQLVFEASAQWVGYTNYITTVLFLIMIMDS